MNDKRPSLLERIKQLEQEVLAQVHKKEMHFAYEVQNQRVRITDTASEQQRKLAKPLLSDLRESTFFNVFTAPVVWFRLVPVVLLHLMASLFQSLCFPVYGTPKVPRCDYLVRDRRILKYLKPRGFVAPPVSLHGIPSKGLILESNRDCPEHAARSTIEAEGGDCEDLGRCDAKDSSPEIPRAGPSPSDPLDSEYNPTALDAMAVGIPRIYQAIAPRPLFLTC